ncbi:leucine-rich repeat protein [Metamycoplasma hyosynoviae]|uniref:leucine-rich repeat protein n=1 Tax=Metamycoplasma hyosynoviae TaxID=29559 RepID=UPI00235851C8|nr:leucine-rich repeat protein [Metamycoplasma hyosynoviae]MDC8962777.1 leucine-rich repeat protein [Metamycoplasma hyosynoviae]
MKEQEQKNLITQEQLPQQNQDKVKSQTPKNKVIIWSAAGAAAAALSSVASLTTVFSNQRKVSFLDKVLQSIKIDVKDKETKTRDDIKTIADFASSNLDTKLYELVVEEVDGEVNKQPLAKDKPYTTFRTKFALRNKITKAQSNFKIFDFKDVRPPKEKQQLNDLGKISEKEEDRVNDKVKIEFVNFNRGQNLASTVAAIDESGKFKHFNIYLKQDNDDILQYEIVNVGVETNDEEAKAIFSYQLKVKSIDDEKFVSDKLSIEFKDFAIPSTRLTEYLNSLNFQYKDVTSTYIQDANKEGIVEATTLTNPNYQFEFENFEKLEAEQKVKAKIKIVDKNTKETSQSRDIEISGFYDYQKAVEELTSQINFDYNDKENTFTNELKKQNLTNNLSSLPIGNKFEVTYYGNELTQGNENDPDARKTAIVSFKIKDKRTQFESSEKSYTIDGFKEYKIKSELDTYLNQIVLDVADKGSKFIENIEYSNITKTNFDEEKYQIDLGTFLIVKQDDLTSIKVHFRITEKNSQNIYSNQRTVEIKDFKIPKKLLDEWAKSISFDVSKKSETMAYDCWDDFNKIDIRRNIDNTKFKFFDQPSVKQTGADELTIRFKIYDLKDTNTMSDETVFKINKFKTAETNANSFDYYLYEHNGHQVACLNKRKIENIFTVPSVIKSFKVKKAMSLYAYENFSRHYCIKVSEGIEEVENLVYTSANATSDLLALSLPTSIKVAKNVIVGPTKNLLYFGMPSTIEQAQGLYESSNTTFGEENVFSNFNYHHGTENFLGKSLDPNDKINWKGGFKFELYHSDSPFAKYRIKPNLDSKYSFLIKIEGNKLAKLIEKKETPNELSLNLDYENFEGIVEGALHGSKATKISLESTKIENLENVFSLANSTLTELDLSKVTKFKYFNKLGPSFNNIQKIKLPDNMGDHLSFSFYGWKNLKEVVLPKTAKYITSYMFYGCKKLEKINFDELINLEQIVHPDDLNNNSGDLKHIHFISSDVMTEIDLSKTNLKKLAGYVFASMKKLGKIILPSTLQRVGRTIAYNNYNTNNTPNNEDDDTITFDQLLTIKIKGTQQKPGGWHNRWIGQYWTSEKPNGTDESKVKIEWGQS